MPENPIDSDSDGEVEDIEDLRMVGRQEDAVEGDDNDSTKRNKISTLIGNSLPINASIINIGSSSRGVESTDISGGDSIANTSLTLLNSERSIVAFSSPAAEYFNSREFRGLLPIVPEGQNTAIQQGQFGIAATYRRYEKFAGVSDADPQS